MAPLAHADPVTVPAGQIDYRPEIHAWAQVKSVAPLELRMPLAAEVARVNVVQGQVVATGTPLVELSGPQLSAQLVAARAKVAASREELKSAQEIAGSVKRNYPVLSDRHAVASAQAALAVAKGKLDEAEASEHALRAQVWLKSPVAATVNAVHVAPGSFLAQGSPVLTLLPSGRLWLSAEVFDASAPRAGKGRFIPSDGGPAIDVRLVSELPVRAADGARVFNFAPAKPDPRWQAGETGELIIRGAGQTAVAVPAGALILDAGQWYVLADAAGKLTPLRVTPGPSRGNDVVILSGLKAGTRVVVRQAYLLYHRDFAAHYTPPD